MQRLRAETVLWALASRYGDTAVVRSLRATTYWLLRYLHAENHDTRTNGEAWLIHALQDQLNVVVDVGAHIGEWTALVLNQCPQVEIHCFDICEKARTALRSRFGTRVVIADHGLLDREDEVAVKQYIDDSRLNSILDFPHEGPAVWRRVRVTTGDAYLAVRNLLRVDLLKIDTEGADLRILRGFESALSAGRITVVQFEYGYAAVLSGDLLHSFHVYLESRGYVLGRLHTRGVDFAPYHLEQERFFGPNFVAVLRSRPDLVRALSR